MLGFFLQPYPLNLDLKRNIQINFFIGIFIGLFLIIFQPFGNSEWQTDQKILKQAGFGFVSFLVPTIMILMTKLIKIPNVEEKWTTGKETLWLVTLLVLIAFGNIYYSRMIGISYISVRAFIESLLMVATIGFFPIMASIILKHNRYKRLNTVEANEMNHAITEYKSHQNPELDTENIITKVALIAENEKDTLSLSIDDVLYLESADNYTQIVYLDDQKVKKELLRGSLKSFELQIDVPKIVRCHRSYIVNLDKVIEITGNAQGYKLELMDSDKLIPVARNYGKNILRLLKK